MKLLVSYLGDSDRDHLRRILNRSIRATVPGMQTMAKVHRFLKQRTYLADKSVPRFQTLPAAQRERILSELVWRLTCFLDGSETSVLGETRYQLGGGFVANQVEVEGKLIFCVAVKA